MLQQQSIEALVPSTFGALAAKTATNPVETQPTIIEAFRAPKIGDDVLYVLPDGHSRGQVRPAKVVRVWGTSSPWMVQLRVFTDGTNDYPTDLPAGYDPTWATSVPYAAAALKEPGTWHWPSEANEA